MNTQLLALVGVFSLLLSGAARPAEVTLVEQGKPPTISFRGEIDRSSVAKLTELLNRFPRESDFDSGPLVIVQSNGGDMEAAIVAGRAIRKALASVFVEFGSGQGVEKNPGCASACVLLYAGGVERVQLGSIAIHNPFVNSESATYEEVKTIRARIGLELRRFLAEMNVSPLLVDRMLAVPSHRLRILPEGELDELGLGMNDPVFADFRLGQLARRYGVTKAAYMERVNAIPKRCGPQPRAPTSPAVETATFQELRQHAQRLSQYSLAEPQLLAKWRACREETLKGQP